MQTERVPLARCKSDEYPLILLLFIVFWLTEEDEIITDFGGLPRLHHTRIPGRLGGTISL